LDPIPIHQSPIPNPQSPIPILNNNIKYFRNKIRVNNLIKLKLVKGKLINYFNYYLID